MTISKMTVAGFFLSSVLIEAASTQLTVSNASAPILDNTGTALDVGVATANGDGDYFEVGYFTGDTATFTGTWVPITGTESNNAALVTTIGDLNPGQDGSISMPAGQFSVTPVFDDGAGTANDLPAGGAQLAVRFYDGATSTGTMYNTVTSNDSAWQFKALSGTPSPPFPALDLGNGGITLVWEDGANPFKTSIIPEPSTTAILGLGGLALFMRRRR